MTAWFRRALPLLVAVVLLLPGTAFPAQEADFDENGIVDGHDLFQLARDWQRPGGLADIDGNEWCDSRDLLLLLQAWHTGVPPTPMETHTGTPVSAETETPAGAPTDTPADAATDTPGDAATDTPAGAPTDTPMQTPVESPTDTPAGTLTDTPTRAPQDTPTDTPRDTPTDTPRDEITYTPTHPPTDTPTGPPTDTPAKTHLPTDTPTETSFVTPNLTITLPGGVTIDFVLCPLGGGSGSFQMGSDDPAWSYINELPVHTVTFTQPFYMGKYEVTQGQWQAIMGSNPAYYSSCGSTCPVELVSWNDCQTFIANLNAHITQTGQGPATFRLPSESEWEYACRAGTTTRFSFGDSTCQRSGSTTCDLSNYAWWGGNYTPSGTKPVGGKLPNPWGLYDMHGNVWEWCQDRWHSGYNGAPTDGSAWNEGTSSLRMLRGGYWGGCANYCRSAYRYWITPGSSNIFIGFRLVSSAP